MNMVQGVAQTDFMRRVRVEGSQCVAGGTSVPYGIGCGRREGLQLDSSTAAHATAAYALSCLV